MLEALEDAATQLEVRVSYEGLSASVGHGGLCRVRGQYRVIIDKRATTEERVATLAQSLGRILAARQAADPAAGTAADLRLPAKVRELVAFYADGQAAPGAARREPPARRAS